MSEGFISLKLPSMMMILNCLDSTPDQSSISIEMQVNTHLHGKKVL